MIPVNKEKLRKFLLSRGWTKKNYPGNDWLFADVPYGMDYKGVSLEKMPFLKGQKYGFWHYEATWVGFNTFKELWDLCPSISSAEQKKIVI